MGTAIGYAMGFMSAAIIFGIITPQEIWEFLMDLFRAGQDASGNTTWNE